VVLDRACIPLGAGRRIDRIHKAVVGSNCDHLKFYIAGKLVAEADPNKTEFAHLPTFAMRHLSLIWGTPRATEKISGWKAIWTENK
jgi:hypothetical protein